MEIYSDAVVLILSVGGVLFGIFNSFAQARSERVQAEASNTKADAQAQKELAASHADTRERVKRLEQALTMKEAEIKALRA